MDEDISVTLESGIVPRQKRRSGAQTAASKITNTIYHKLTEVVKNMASLTETQPLTDTTVLMVSVIDCHNLWNH